METSKACQETDIPTKIVKENADIFANVLLSNFNDSFEKSNFPSILKNATITPVFKKVTGTLRITLDQLAYSRIYLKSLRDAFLLEKWKSAGDKGKSFGALLTDLSKAFDCLSHELLLAKLHAYGFSIAALRLIHSYLTNR